MPPQGFNPKGNDKGPLPPNWGSPPQPQPPASYWAPPPYWPGYGYAIPGPSSPQMQIPIRPWSFPVSPPPFYPPAFSPPSYGPEVRAVPPQLNTTTPQPNRKQTSGHKKPSDGGMPCVHMKNPYGGIGNPPGFNYFFPDAHSPIIFIRSGSVRPWHSSFAAHASNPFNERVKQTPFMVASNTTVLELLSGVGARNENKEKNVVTEVVSQGNGRWKRGLCIHAGEERAKKKIYVPSFLKRRFSK